MHIFSFDTISISLRGTFLSLSRETFVNSLINTPHTKTHINTPRRAPQPLQNTHNPHLFIATSTDHLALSPDAVRLTEPTNSSYGRPSDKITLDKIALLAGKILKISYKKFRKVIQKGIRALENQNGHSAAKLSTQKSQSKISRYEL